MMFIWTGLIIFIGNVNQIVFAEDGKGADARSTDVSVGCFAGDSMVQLTNGQLKQIGHLQTGDRITSVENSKLSADEMFLMMDKEPFQQGIFTLISSLEIPLFFS